MSHYEKQIEESQEPQRDDAVNHPAHYTAYPGIEVIQLTEHLNFCKGNAVKYIARAGIKDTNKEIEDLRKAVWYLERECERIERANRIALSTGGTGTTPSGSWKGVC